MDKKIDAQKEIDELKNRNAELEFILAALQDEKEVKPEKPEPPEPPLPPIPPEPIDDTEDKRRKKLRKIRNISIALAAVILFIVFCNYANTNLIVKKKYSNGDKYYGEMADGKPSGKGKIKDKYGEVVAEGEFKDGELWVGTMTDIDEDGNVIYKGEIVGGDYHGEGTLFVYCDGEAVGKQEGEFYDGQFMNGNGVFANEYGITYDGKVKNGKYHGQGISRWYDDYGEVESVFEGTYDNGERKKGKMTYYEDGGKDHEYEYNADGLNIRSYYYKNSALDYYYEHEYNASGKEIKTTKYSADGVKEYEFEYNSNGKITKSNWYEDGILDHYYKYTYNSSGKETKMEYYNSLGKMEYYKVSEYGPNGSKIRTTQYYPNGLPYN